MLLLSCTGSLLRLVVAERVCTLLLLLLLLVLQLLILAVGVVRRHFWVELLPLLLVRVLVLRGWVPQGLRLLTGEHGRTEGPKPVLVFQVGLRVALLTGWQRVVGGVVHQLECDDWGWRRRGDSVGNRAWGQAVLTFGDVEGWSGGA